MTEYAIALPIGVPSGSNNPSVPYAYQTIPKLGKTTAANPKDALGHFFFKYLGTRKTTAKSMINLFSPYAERYVFEVPKIETHDAKGKRMSLKESSIFQAMDLALEMAEKRNCRPEDCYGDALEIVAL